MADDDSPNVHLEERIDAECAKVRSTDDLPKEPLWHYCGADGCQGIVATDEIFATHYGFTNDTEELLRGQKIVFETVQRMVAAEMNQQKRELLEMVAKILPEQQMNALQADVFLACFTASPGPDDLTQWSGYGHRGTGYALQLDLKLPEQLPVDRLGVTLAKVIYDDNEFAKLVQDQVERYVSIYLANNPDPATVSRVASWIRLECALLSPRLKHSCFAHEREWRLIAVPRTKNAVFLIEFRKRDPNILVPYVKISIGHVVRAMVIGPAHGGEATARLYAAKMLLAKHCYGASLAKLSPIPYRG